MPVANQTPQQTSTTAAETIANTVLDNLVQDPNVNLTNATKGDIKAEVIRETTAVVMNQTNTEPWYQSRITVSQYVTLIATLLGIFGYAVAPELRDQIIGAVLAIGMLINPLVTLWARWFAKKPMTILGDAAAKPTGT